MLARGRLDCYDHFYVHVVFSGQSAVSAQEYYDFIEAHRIDERRCWQRGVLDDGQECQLRFTGSDWRGYLEAKIMVETWVRTRGGFRCKFRACFIKRAGKLSGTEPADDYSEGMVEVNGSYCPGEKSIAGTGCDEDTTGGRIRLFWSAALRPMTRQSRYESFVCLIPAELDECWRHDFNSDGSITLAFRTPNDELYIQMIDVIKTYINTSTNSYLFSEVEELPSKSVAETLAREEENGVDDLQVGTASNQTATSPPKDARKRQAYLTTDGRRKEKRRAKERDRRRLEREERDAEYEQRLADDPEFAASEARRKEERREKERERRRLKKKEAKDKKVTSFLFGKIFGPERWDEMLAQYKEKGLGGFMPVSNPLGSERKLLTTYPHGHYNLVDKEFFYRDEEDDEDHPDAVEGKVPRIDNAPFYDMFDQWYRHLRIHWTFLKDVKDKDISCRPPDKEQEHYPFIELTYHIDEYPSSSDNEAITSASVTRTAEEEQSKSDADVEDEDEDENVSLGASVDCKGEGQEYLNAEDWGASLDDSDAGEEEERELLLDDSDTSDGGEQEVLLTQERELSDESEEASEEKEGALLEETNDSLGESRESRVEGMAHVSAERASTGVSAAEDAEDLDDSSSQSHSGAIQGSGSCELGCNKDERGSTREGGKATSNTDISDLNDLKSWVNESTPPRKRACSRRVIHDSDSEA